LPSSSGGGLFVALFGVSKTPSSGVSAPMDDGGAALDAAAVLLPIALCLVLACAVYCNCAERMGLRAAPVSITPMGLRADQGTDEVPHQKSRKKSSSIKDKKKQYRAGARKLATEEPADEDAGSGPDT